MFQLASIHDASSFESFFADAHKNAEMKTTKNVCS